MSHDILIKRAIFISNVHALRQELGYQDPEVFMQLSQTYLGSMYGSNLWDLYSSQANRIFTSWNMLIRTSFNLPYATHRYILYNITNIPHIRISLIKRFIKFYSRLESSFRPEVRLLFNLQKSDCRSTFGRNCFNICNEFDVRFPDQVKCNNISMPIKMPDNESWRIPFIFDIINSRDSNSVLNSDEINYILEHVCSN